MSAYLHLIANSMSQLFVRGIAEIAEAYVSVKRLQHFLDCDEINPQIVTNNIEIPETDDVAVSVTNLKAKWIIGDLAPVKIHSITDSLVAKDHSQEYTLDQINLNFKRGSLIGIVGSVGSGSISGNTRLEYITS